MTSLHVKQVIALCTSSAITDGNSYHRFNHHSLLPLQMTSVASSNMPCHEVYKTRVSLGELALRWLWGRCRPV